MLTTVFGGICSTAMGFTVDAVIWCLLLATAVLAQSAVNTINDWADYRAGTDTVENSDDPTDAVLVYNNPNPRHVLLLGVGYLLAGFCCGLVCMVWAESLYPLIIALIGFAFVFLYSSGKLPVSYLPLGELVSGVVMGCLIPLADMVVFAAHELAGTGAGWFAMPPTFEWLAAILSTLPFVLGIGMVMATQNNCDIERDQAVGRRTLPVVLGRQRSVMLYRVFAVVWLALVLALSALWFLLGLWAACVLMVLGSGFIRKMLITPLTPQVRGPSMGTISACNLVINGAYIVAIVMTMLM